MRGSPVVHEPLEALEALHTRGVRFVVVGGFGAQLHGSPQLTRDLDICFQLDPRNVERLTAVLHDLRAITREGRRRRPTAELLTNEARLAFDTQHGELDCISQPSGMWRGYEELERAADEMDLGGFSVLVASVDDLIRMKRALGRPKDLIAVENLGALRDEIDAQAAEGRRMKRSVSRKKESSRDG